MPTDQNQKMKNQEKKMMEDEECLRPQGRAP